MEAASLVSLTGESSPETYESLDRVVVASTSEDGAAPLDEAATLALRHGLEGTSLWVATDAGEVRGFAWLHGGALDLVVHPDARRQGLGRALLDAALDAAARDVTAWSHGNHPAAAALARATGFERARDLWVMRRSLHGLPALPDADGVDVRTFRVGVDEDAWLAVNREAFAHHPEQGGTTRRDLEEREAEPWFDPAGFFLAWRGDELVGFHWTK